MFYTYILYSEQYDMYYIGQTQNVEERFDRHNTGKVISTSKHRPWKLLLSIEKPTRSAAMELEKKLKNLSKERKAAFIEKYG
jgi:putative endonuclease